MVMVIKKIVRWFRKNIIAPISYRRTLSMVAARRSVPSSSYPVFVFLVNYPEMWNSVKSVYEEVHSREDARALVIAIPHIKKGIVDQRNAAADFFDTQGITYINAYNAEKRTWYNLQQLSPSYVMYIRPYEKEYPSEYRPNIVALFSRTCLFSYGYLDVNAQKYMAIMYNRPFMRGINYVFSGQMGVNQELRTIYRRAIEKGFLKISDTGFTRFELIKKCTEDHSLDQCFHIVWTPRWAVRDNPDLTTFFDYKDRLIDYVMKNKNVQLTCRPHPAAFDSFIKEGCMTAEEVEAFKLFLKETPRFHLDENKDYLDSFRSSDVLVGDTSGILIEYFLTGKPVVYTGKAEGMLEDSAKVYQCFYSAQSWDEIAHYLDILQSGTDEKKASRDNLIEELNPGQGVKASVKIVNELLEEWAAFR